MKQEKKKLAKLELEIIELEARLAPQKSAEFQCVDALIGDDVAVTGAEC